MGRPISLAWSAATSQPVTEPSATTCAVMAARQPRLGQGRDEAIIESLAQANDE